ncbi:hypothetical protein GCM10029964_052510 [Kibdelosporangium lantanae]
MTGLDQTALAARPAGPLARARRRAGESRVGVLLGSAFLVLLAVAVVAPWVFTSAGPDDADPVATLAPPGARYWLGADENGRDIFTRVVHGARASVLIGLGASGLALVVGTLVGCSPHRAGGSWTAWSAGCSTSCCRSPACCWCCWCSPSSAPVSATPSSVSP